MVSATLIAMYWLGGRAPARAGTEGVPAKKAEPAVYRLNCGATQDYTDKAGRVWKPDAPYRAKVDWESTRNDGNIAIKNTDDPTIYQTSAYGDLFYHFKMDNGAYRVVLYFAETYSWTRRAGEREFDVLLQGRPVLEKFDPFKETGGQRIALVKEFSGIVVSDGVLRVTLVPFKDDPQIQGIEIFRQ